MKTVYSPDHAKHWLRFEVSAGETKPCFEKPSRAEYVLAELKKRQLGEIIDAKNFDIKHVEKVHSSKYIKFLQTCWSQWEQEMGGDLDAVATVFSRPDLGHREPEMIEGKLGFYSADLSVGLGRDSWQAIKASANVALQAADLIVSGEQSAFALCRPAGHHASEALMAGYCYLNNAAIACEYLLGHGKQRVAVLDIDYHHGNGTQGIFYERRDVLFTSIHGNPEQEYPFYLGHADEVGKGEGEGFNLNCPLPLGSTDWPKYEKALNQCLQRIKEFDADVLVISLGVDTFIDDPISHFQLGETDFKKIGQLLASAVVPTLFVFEGGYAVKELGVNTVNVLESFEVERARVGI